MKHYVGLDVSVKETAICIVDETEKMVREAKITTEPEGRCPVDRCRTWLRSGWAGGRADVAMDDDQLA